MCRVQGVGQTLPRTQVDATPGMLLGRRLLTQSRGADSAGEKPAEETNMNLLEVIDLPVSDTVPSALPAQAVEAGEEYNRLCKLVGYGTLADPAAHPLARWLQRNEVPVYAMADVQAYVERRAKEMRWRSGSITESPMRSVDKSDWSSTPVYDQAVPIEVLRLVGAMVQEFKGEVKFMVLNVQEDKDPFLKVEHTKSRESFIVAHWDEPGFSIRG